MEASKQSTMVFALSAVMLIVGVACLGYSVLNDSCDCPDQNRYTVYIGLGDADEKRVEEVKVAMANLITSYGYGYNVDLGAGAAVVDGKVLADKSSLRFIITNASDSEVEEMVQYMQDHHGIKAIFVEKDLVKATLFLK